MIALLVGILVWLLVFGLVSYVIGLLPLPAPFKQIALAVLGVVALIVLVEHFLPYLAGVH